MLGEQYQYVYAWPSMRNEARLECDAGVGKQHRPAVSFNAQSQANSPELVIKRRSLKVRIRRQRERLPQELVLPSTHDPFHTPGDVEGLTRSNAPTGSCRTTCSSSPPPPSFTRNRRRRERKRATRSITTWLCGSSRRDMSQHADMRLIYPTTRSRWSGGSLAAI